MPGGLIEISTYGSQDIFLTGTPEITFFKVVYRRYTNFSMESVKISFDDPVSWDNESTVKIPKVGDLMHKTYLEVILPEINLFRKLCKKKINEAKCKFKRANDELNAIYEFMHINVSAYRAAYNRYIAENNIENVTKDMICAIKHAFSGQHNLCIINKAKELLIAIGCDVPFCYNQVSMESISNNFCIDSDKNSLFKALSIGINKSIKVQKYFFDIMNCCKETLDDLENNHIKFAWVDRIGHAIINSIEIRIGGYKIDKHYDNWLNIWYELTANRYMENIYFDMIGNVPELTDFNRKPKPKYVLRIPLQFWFCRYSGLSIPLVALEYHDVNICCRFRKFSELCYIEECTKIKCGDNELSLDDVPDDLDININAYLLVDYIYLDSFERRRFAQSSHEYLIDQLQVLKKRDIIQQNLQFNVDNFVQPSKELVWVSQKTSFTVNFDGSNQCRWNNYSETKCNKINPIKHSSIDFHGYTRSIKLTGNYYNYVQPYETHPTTPSDGINMYSFSLFPVEFQPSGSANMSRLDRVTIHMYFRDIEVEDPLIVSVFTRNLNILRFASGFSGMAFVYS